MTREERDAIEGIRADVRDLTSYVRASIDGPSGLLVRLAVVERDVASLLDRSEDSGPPARNPVAGGIVRLPDLGSVARVGAVIGTLMAAMASGAAATWAAMRADSDTPIEAADRDQGGTPTARQD